jgi:predicted alpha/beta-fold hydrolase
MLANYAGRKGKANPLTAQVGVGCHFDKKYLDHISTYCLGFFNYFLGLNVLHINK